MFLLNVGSLNNVKVSCLMGIQTRSEYDFTRQHEVLTYMPFGKDWKLPYKAFTQIIRAISPVAIFQGMLKWTYL